MPDDKCGTDPVADWRIFWIAVPKTQMKGRFAVCRGVPTPPPPLADCRRPAMSWNFGGVLKGWPMLSRQAGEFEQIEPAKVPEVSGLISTATILTFGWLQFSSAEFSFCGILADTWARKNVPSTAHVAMDKTRFRSPGPTMPGDCADQPDVQLGGRGELRFAPMTESFCCCIGPQRKGQFQWDRRK